MMSTTFLRQVISGRALPLGPDSAAGAAGGQLDYDEGTAAGPGQVPCVLMALACLASLSNNCAVFTTFPAAHLVSCV
jgi:hypothetical protein